MNKITATVFVKDRRAYRKTSIFHDDGSMSASTGEIPLAEFDRHQTAAWTGAIWREISTETKWPAPRKPAIAGLLTTHSGSRYQGLGFNSDA